METTNITSEKKRKLPKIQNTKIPNMSSSWSQRLRNLSESKLEQEDTYFEFITHMINKTPTFSLRVSKGLNLRKRKKKKADDLFRGMNS